MNVFGFQNFLETKLCTYHEADLLEIPVRSSDTYL